MTCLQWYEPGDPHTWEDNFLCWQYVAPTVDAGSPPSDAAVDAARDVIDVTLPDAADADGVDVEVIDAALDRPEVVGLPDIGMEDAAVTEDLPPVEDVSIEEQLIPAEEDGGCGCGVPSGGRPRTGAALGAALLVALGARRRRGRARDGA
jgi:MYXO-CTERM domain-containing protein